MTLESNQTTPSEISQSFTFALPTEVIFGPGSLRSLGHRTAALGRRGLIVTSPGLLLQLGVEHTLRDLFTEARIEVEVFDAVETDPSTDTVNKAILQAKRQSIEFVIGVGGGSAIDAAKAVAAGSVYDGDEVWDLILGGRPGSEAVGPQTLPVAAVPTTAGTGSEVTTGAVLRNPVLRSKECIGSRHIAPRLAVVDPSLTLSMPVSLTAATGLDALTQCIEAYVSQRANAVSDALALQGMALISRHLRRVVADGDDLEARCAMSLGAMLSGMALSQAGVGAAHAISMVLGGRYGVQHGIGVSLFLAGTIALNARAAPAKYLEVARALGAEVHGLSPTDGGEMAIGAVHALVTDVGLDTRLDDLGVPREEYPEIARAAASHPDMGPNPARLTPRDIEDLLKRAA